MTVEEIKSLPIADLALSDCVLLLWVTDPFLFKSREVIEAWGFEFKTVGFYWAKEPLTWFGTGYWGRANPEMCLLATCGKAHRKNADVPKLVVSPRREHSRKPDEMYGLIERLCHGPYIELFARQRHEGWDAWGREVDEGPNQERRWRSDMAPTVEVLDSLENL